MSILQAIFTAIIGQRIAMRFIPSVRKTLDDRLKKVKREKPVPVQFKSYAKEIGVITVVYIAWVALAPLLIPKFIFIPLQNLTSVGDGLLFPLDGQYLFSIVTLFVGAVLGAVVMTMVIRTNKNMHLYSIADGILSSQILNGKRKAIKDKEKRLKALQKIASEYDLIKYVEITSGRATIAVVIIALLALPFYYMSFNSYTRITEEGISVNHVMQFTETEYEWSEVRSGQLSVETETAASDGEEHRVAEFNIEFTDDKVVDIWQFGLVDVGTNNLLAACQAFHDAGRSNSIDADFPSGLSSLRESKQEQIQTVMGAEVCGGFSLCSGLEDGSITGQILGCE